MSASAVLDSGWREVVGVPCVCCPACAFTFDRVHEDEGGGYSCPLCEIERLRAELAKARKPVSRTTRPEVSLEPAGCKAHGDPWCPECC
jgi:hypothetical protein